MWRNKEKKTPRDIKTIHLPQADQCATSFQATAALKKISPIYCWACYIVYEWYHPRQFGSAVAALSPPNFWATPTYLLAKQSEKQRKICCCVSPAQQYLKPWCVTNTVLLTNPDHSTFVVGSFEGNLLPPNQTQYTVVQYLRNQISVALSSALILRIKQYSIENNVIYFFALWQFLCFNKQPEVHGS